MSAESVVLLPHLVLLIGAAICFAGGGIVKHARLWGPFCLLMIAIAGAVLARAARLSFDPAVSRIVDQSTLGVLLQWGALALGAFYVFVATDTSKSMAVSPRVFGAILLAICGLLLACVAGELWLIFAAVELTGVPISVMLYASRATPLSRQVARKHLLVILLSSALFLLAMILIYGATGSTNLAGIRESCVASATTTEAWQPPALIGTAGFVLVLAALGTRVAAAPFQFGFAELLDGGSSWNGGVLMAFSQAVGFVVVIRLLVQSLPGYERVGESACLVLSAFSMTAGSALAVMQSNIRRMLAYMAIANSGLALLALAAGFWDVSTPDQKYSSLKNLPAGIEACLFLLGSTWFATGGFVAVLAYLARSNRQVDYVEDLAGITSREPLAAVCGAVCLLSLSGVPPLPGFWGRLFVWGASLAVHPEPDRQHLPETNTAFLLLTILSIACMGMLAAACIRVIIVAFFEGQVARPEPTGGQPALAAAVLATMLTVGIGLLPGPLIGLLHRNVSMPKRLETSPAAVQVNPPADRTVRVDGIGTEIPVRRGLFADPRPGSAP